MTGSRGKVNASTLQVAMVVPEGDATISNLNYSGGHNGEVCLKATYQAPENHYVWSMTVYCMHLLIHVKSDNNNMVTSSTRGRTPVEHHRPFRTQESRLMRFIWNFLMQEVSSRIVLLDKRKAVTLEVLEWETGQQSQSRGVFIFSPSYGVSYLHVCQYYGQPDMGPAARQISKSGDGMSVRTITDHK